MEIGSPEDLARYIGGELAHSPTVWIELRPLLRDGVWGGLADQTALEEKVKQFCEEHDYDCKIEVPNNRAGFSRRG